MEPFFNLQISSKESHSEQKQIFEQMCIFLSFLSFQVPGLRRRSVARFLSSLQQSAAENRNQTEGGVEGGAAKEHRVWVRFSWDSLDAHMPM